MIMQSKFTSWGKKESEIMALTEKATATLVPLGALLSDAGLLAEIVTVKYDSGAGLYIMLTLSPSFGRLPNTNIVNAAKS